MIDRDRLRAAVHRITAQLFNIPIFASTNMRRDWLSPPKLVNFKRLEPIGFGLIDEDDFWIFSPEDCTADVVWPLDVGVVVEREQGGFSLHTTRSVSPKQCRGYARRFSPYMVRTDFAQIVDGELLSGASLFSWCGGKWVDAQGRVMWRGRTAEDVIPDRTDFTEDRDREQPALATAFALRQRYEWAVALGLENAPTLRFNTDPTGIKEAFRVRDLPEGRDRRAALINWVGDHWRQNRHDPDVENYVRRHLRGVQTFSWQGLQGEILPAQFDLDRAEKLAADREGMRRIGADRRLRKPIAHVV